MVRLYKGIFMISLIIALLFLHIRDVQAKEAELLGSYNMTHIPDDSDDFYIYNRILAPDGSIFYSNENYIENAKQEFGCYDKYGNLLWRKEASGSENCKIQSVTLNSEVLVETEKNIIKYDKSGRELWRLYIGTTNKPEMNWGRTPILKIVLTNDKGDRHLVITSSRSRPSWAENKAPSNGYCFTEKLCVLDKNGNIIKVLQEYFWSAAGGFAESLYPDLPVIEDLNKIEKINGKYVYSGFEFSDNFESLVPVSAMGKFVVSTAYPGSAVKQFSLSYLDASSREVWKKNTIAGSSTNDNGFCKIILQTKDYCYIAYGKEKGTLTVKSVDVGGNTLWEISFPGIKTGVASLGRDSSSIAQRFDNGEIQVVNGFTVYYLTEPTPEITATVKNYRIGDNTKAAFYISLDNSSGIETELKAYINNVLKYSGSLGTAATNKLIEVDCGGTEGLIKVDFDLYGFGRVVDSKTATVDKYNLLNNLSIYRKTNINTLLILNGSDRIFDNNTANQALINSIKNKGLDIYIIHNNLNIPLTNILEE